ncbi:type II toxin-antitoxin system RatA family toxin [Nocardia aurantia]|uniref:Coenzyme Q-binding protein COQ10 START domain-containing protein n=1 Tax=Nocardia aurantia TaxID=2585199 RepID=A0A7K0DL67_9NOCA|nr:SRPBCC family protein [Nocardia aurantia]MQY26401.1 hypothetical protein [Nocardia aurantia]
MRSLQLSVRAAHVDADTAYDTISRFERFTEVADDVRPLRVRRAGADLPAESDWEAHFPDGVMTWTQVDYCQSHRRTVVFEQISGDFDVFRGSWRVEPDGDGCEVRFEATFDFGTSTLAGLLEQVAVPVLRRGIEVAVQRLLFTYVEYV